MRVKIKLLNDSARLPAYGSECAAGADLYACLSEPVTILPGQRVKIPTGIAMECERDDVVGIVSARSGLSSKHGIALANGIGVIDSDYRGEIMISAVNLSDVPYTVNHGERVAQLMILPVIHAEFEQSDDLCDTARGIGGFGSTGK